VVVSIWVKWLLDNLADCVAGGLQCQLSSRSLMDRTHYRQKLLATLTSVTTLIVGSLPLLAATHVPPKEHAEIVSAVSEPNTESRVSPIRKSHSEELIAQQSSFTSFFEEGRLRSEDRLRLQRPPDPAIPVAQKSNFWQPVIFSTGGCSFWLPPGILSEETVLLDTSVGKLGFRTLASNSDNARYVAAYAERLTRSQLEDPQALLRAIRNKVAPTDEFQLKTDTPIALNKYPGREMTLLSAKETITFRAYLVEQRVYILGARYPNASALSRQVAGFLNSFQLLQRS